MTTVMNPNMFGEDGVDHILVSPTGATELGRLLSPKWGRMFRHPVLGEFESLDNMKRWILDVNHDDSLRTSPDRVRQDGVFVKERSSDKKTNNKWIKNVTDHLIVSGVTDRIIQDPALLKKLIENELPILSYRNNSQNDLRITIANNGWFYQGIDDVFDCVNDNISVFQFYEKMGIDLNELTLILLKKESSV